MLGLNMRMYISNLFIKLPVMFVVLVYLMSMQISSAPYLFIAIINAFLVINEFFSSEERPYTLHKIINFFILFFFILANAVQFSTNSIVTSLSISFNEYDYVFFQILVLAIVVFFNLFYHFFINIAVEFHIRQENNCINQKRLLMLSTIAFILVLIYYSNQISRLFFRGFAENMNVSSNINSSTINLLFNKFIRSFPFACLYIALTKNAPKWCIVLLFIETLIAIFPLGLPRNSVAMYWIPIMIVCFRFFNKKYFFGLILSFSLLILFPFLDNFRNYNGNISFSSINLDYLNTMNFDASQEFMALIHYDVITYGRQLLGVLFFWVPRSIWVEKPVGSGFFLAQNQNAFTNISMPFFAEGFINFGYIGMFMFTIGLSFFCASFDNAFWEKKMNQKAHLWSGYYLLLIGGGVFVMRGDLLSSFAYIVGIALAYFFCKKIACYKSNCL